MAIGTLAEWRFGRSERHLAPCHQRSASSGVDAHPSAITAARTDRRSGSQNSGHGSGGPQCRIGPVSHVGNLVARGSDRAEDRGRLVEARHDLGVGLVDAPAAGPSSRAERIDGLGAPSGRDPPVDVDDLRALREHSAGEHRQPDVHDPHLLGKGHRGRCGRTTRLHGPWSLPPTGRVIIGSVFPCAGFEIVSDEPPEFGGDDAGPTPTELLVSSMAVCFTMAVVHAFRKRERDPARRRREGHGRLRRAPSEPVPARRAFEPAAGRDRGADGTRDQLLLRLEHAARRPRRSSTWWPTARSRRRQPFSRSDEPSLRAVQELPSVAPPRRASSEASSPTDAAMLADDRRAPRRRERSWSSRSSAGSSTAERSRPSRPSGSPVGLLRSAVQHRSCHVHAPEALGSRRSPDRRPDHLVCGAVVDLAGLHHVLREVRGLAEASHERLAASVPR